VARLVADSGQLLPFLLQGARVTLLATLLAAWVALVFAFAAGLARFGAPRVVRTLATAYVEIFRGTSLIIQLFYLFFVLPFFGVSLPPLATGVIGLGLNFGAYGSEVVRGAINAVPQGQWEAALALNMTHASTMRRIIVPQAILAMLPPFGNLLVELLKATSLLSLIQITDLAFAGTMLFQSTGKSIEIYSLILLIYFAMAFPMTILVRRLERRFTFGVSLSRRR